MFIAIIMVFRKTTGLTMSDVEIFVNFCVG